MTNANESRVTLQTNLNKNLYDWCLKQLNEQGREVDLIPVDADKDFYFQVEEINIYDSIAFDFDCEINTEKESRTTSEKPSNQYRPEKRVEQSISLTLKPWAYDETTPPRFLFVGSNQPVTKFTLKIFDSQSSNITAKAYAAPGELFDMDLAGDVWFEGFLQFKLSMPTDDYSSILESLLDAGQSNHVLEIRNIHGLYSEWSPPLYGADPTEIYLLTKEQVIESSDDCQTATRLGHIGYFAITTLKNLS